MLKPTMRGKRRCQEIVWRVAGTGGYADRQCNRLASPGGDYCPRCRTERIRKGMAVKPRMEEEVFKIEIPINRPNANGVAFTEETQISASIDPVVLKQQPDGTMKQVGVLKAVDIEPEFDSTGRLIAFSLCSKLERK